MRIRAAALALAFGVAAAAGAGRAAAQAAAEQQGVLTFAPDYFAQSRPNTAADMINRLPGFALDGGGSARGFAGNAGNVLIDGRRPATKSDSLSEILARIPADQVERIELIRGGATGIDMQGQSVVANVVRKHANTTRQTLTLSDQIFVGQTRNLPMARYELTRTVGERTYEFSAQRFSSLDDSTGDIFRDRRDAAGALLSHEEGGNEGDGFGGVVRGTVRTPLWGGQLRVNGSAQYSNFKSELLFDTPAANASIDGNGNHDYELGVNFVRPLSHGLELELIGIQQLGDSLGVSTYDEAGFHADFTGDYDTGESIVRGILRWRRSENLSFEGGAEGAFNYLEGHTAYTENGVPIPLPSSNVRVEERRGEIFGQGTWRLSPRLSLEAGARVEFSTISETGDTALERSFVYPKPRVLLTWAPRESTQFRLRFEREVGQLNFGDFVSSANLTNSVVSAGNPDLEPSKNWTTEATFERRFWTDGALVLTYIHQDIEDAIDRIPYIGPGYAFDAPGNIGKGTNDVLRVNLTLPLGRVGMTGGQFRMTTAFANSSVTDPTTGEKRDISGQRPDTINLTLRQDLPARKLTWSLSYYGGWQEDYYRFNELQHYEIRNYFAGAIEYKPDRNTTWTLQAQNLMPFVFDRDRTFFTGRRDLNPVLFTERLESQSVPRLALTYRRSW